MKKTFWALAALIVMAGAITFVACSKDKTDSETQQVATKEAGDLKTVGYSNPGSMEIIPLVDKDAFLERLEQYLNSEEAGRYVAEDLKMWHEPYGDGKYAPMMCVSFFDLKEEHGNAIFIKMEELVENGMVYYVAGSSSDKVPCVRVCEKECKFNADEMSCWCPDPKPTWFPSPEDEARWHMNHYCRVKEPSLGKILEALVKKIFDLFF